jgi:hypothetical protein
VRRKPLAPQQLLSLHIAGLIAVGTILLWLPVSAAPGRQITLVNALFTSTSAVCVTGLVVVDVAKDLSRFGQVVVMLLIQAGGLGYMTISTLVAVALGRRVTLQERLTLQEALSDDGGDPEILDQHRDQHARLDVLAGVGETTNVAPSAEDRIEAGDVLSLLGSNERLSQLDALLRKK